MKTRTHLHRETAVALIIVLAMLVLLSGLIVSFMTAVGNERAASVISNNELTSRQIADSTVNLVISQVRQATSQSGDPNSPTTWASQPGAIRTYSGKVSGVKNVSNGATAPAVRQAAYNAGSNDFVFKLYSAENMKVASSTFGILPWDRGEVDTIDNWNWKLSEKEREDAGMFGYVDLNEPIVTPMPEELAKGDRTIVEPRYPIIDPRAKYDQDEKANSSAEPGIVEGFDIKTSKLENDKLKFLPKSRTGARNNQTPRSVPYLPMPVKWLYVMRDGSMAAAEDKSKGKIPGASKDNPVIGRTAFWTDDDSARLNINTSSEGTFWDTPASSRQDSGDVDGNLAIQLNATDNTLSLAAAQPARGEYQRYPGHPATTSLSPALGWMWDIMPNQWPRQFKDPKLVAMKDAIAQLSPFLAYGKRGTLSATEPPNSTTMGGSFNPAKETLASNPDLEPLVEKDPKLAIGTKHLYSTVDELVFKQERVPVSPARAADPTSLNGLLIPESLEKVRFFLTANSRAPELNLFGRPRVTFWPVNADPTQRTGFDDLFAFTSTFYKNLNDPTGKSDNTFFFTRSNARSATKDYNAKNQAMLDYLKTFTSKKYPIPGFGGSFADKYGDDEVDEILTLIFDYCRCVNLVDTSTRVRTGAPFRPFTPFYGNSKAYNSNGWTPRSQDFSAQVTPIRTFPSSKHQGLGRVPMIAEAAIVFHRAGPTGTKLQATLLFKMATVMAGFPAIRETYWMTVEAQRPTTAGPAANNLADIQLVGSTRWNIVNVGSHDVGYGRSYLPILGFMNQLHYFPELAAPRADSELATVQTGQAKGKTFAKDPSTMAVKPYLRQKAINYYPFVSDLFDVPPGNTANLFFSGGKFKVDMYAGEAPDDDQRNELIQTVIIDFPPETISVPVPGPAGKDMSFTTRLNGMEQNTALGPNDGNSWNVFNYSTDVIRSMEFVGAKPDGKGGYQSLADDRRGDLRLGAAMRLIPGEAYAPRGGIAAYKLTTQRIHGMATGHADPYAGYYGTPGIISSSVGTNRGNKPPILPADIKGVKREDGELGDWDRGLSKHTDGAMANKVDEGNVQFDDRRTDGGKLPYFLGRSIQETGKSFFSPNRQLSSAVMFGSLPTGAVSGKPWQTLLFRPDHGTKPHPGGQQVGRPADHLILDLFNLPVVEPYAISEPFSTGGKVNLNYIIAPFGYAKGDTGKRKGTNMDRSYLRRDTALRGVMKSVKVMAVPSRHAEAAHEENPLNNSVAFRFDIDADRTLDQFENRFKDPDRGLFRSASEICDMDLYPFYSAQTAGVVAPQSTTPPQPGAALTDWGKFWETDFAQTGDNMRERPYSYIYPRVTTKSNVFTIYMRCQAIKKAAGSPDDIFDPVKDKVIGAYRGSATIERFIDPNDPELQGYVPTSQNASVDQLYRYRVLGTKQFLPR